MSDHSDALSLLITAAMMALIRLIDAWVIIRDGLPLDSLQPRSADQLDADAQRYVDLILADRR